MERDVKSMGSLFNLNSSGLFWKWLKPPMTKRGEAQAWPASQVAGFRTAQHQIDWAEILLRISLRDACMRVPALELAESIIVV